MRPHQLAEIVDSVAQQRSRAHVRRELKLLRVVHALHVHVRLSSPDHDSASACLSLAATAIATAPDKEERA